MKLFALTGSIASGKSLLCQLLETQGYHSIDCDHLGRNLLKQQSIVEDIKQLFNLNGSYSTEQLTEILRSYLLIEKKRERLEAYLHPKINNELQTLLESSRQLSPIIVCLSAPSALSTFHFPWTKKLSLETHCLIQMQRLKVRYTKAPPEFIRDLSQLHRRFRALRGQWADQVFWNNASIDSLGDTVLSYLNQY